MKKKVLTGVTSGLLILGMSGLANAVNIATLSRQTIFTNFTSSPPEIIEDPNNILPFPHLGEGATAGNVARINLDASPGQAGQATAWTGLNFDWNLQGLSFEDAKDRPVRVTFDFVYTIQANYTPGTGSANAGVVIPGFSKTWEDFVGYERGKSDNITKHFNETLTKDWAGNDLTLGNLQKILGVEVYGQAHSAQASGKVNSSFSSALFNRIIIEDITPQYVFVDFDENKSSKIPVLGTPTFTKPSAGLTDPDEDTIVAKLNSIYKDYFVEFVKEKPSEGYFSTLYVGGTVNDLGENYKNSFSPASLGKAESIDIGNKNENDFALIFSGHDAFKNDINLLGQTLAHEAGHILGLYHVYPHDELMFPYAGATKIDIDKATQNRGEIAKANGLVVKLDGYQNSYEELARNLGLRDASIEIVGTSSAPSEKIKVGFGALASTIYDAKLGIIICEDAMPTIFDLGDIEIGKNIFIDVPFINQENIFIFGSSIDGGNIDIVSSSEFSKLPHIFSIQNIDYNLLSLAGVLNDGIDLNMYKWESDQGYNSIGSLFVESVLENSPVPEPTTMLLFGTGIAGLAAVGRRKRS